MQEQHIRLCSRRPALKPPNQFGDGPLSLCERPFQQDSKRPTDSPCSPESKRSFTVPSKDQASSLKITQGEAYGHSADFESATKFMFAGYSKDAL